jgi:outer membrane protein assembly factor BamB
MVRVNSSAPADKSRAAIGSNPRAFALAVLVFAGASAACFAGDWPQILGPHRDGIAENESLADSWPADGPKVVWQRRVGRGYAGLAVAGQRAILFHRLGDQEVVEALDSATGTTLWKSSTPTAYQSTISPDDGPRCVPVIHGGKIILFGVQGQLSCLGLVDGQKLWSRDTHADFHASEGYFGAGSSPLVEQDKVIVNVGGARSAAGVVAFALETGKTLWTVGRDDASYSSPIAVTVNGTRHVIVETRLTTYSLDPTNGHIRFRIPFGQRGPTVNGANPTVIGDHLFLTASYGVGALYGQIQDAGFKQLWESDDLISSQYTTCIQDHGVLFGISGRDDVGRAVLRCIDPEHQKILWEKESFGYATLLKADGKLLAQKTDGTLMLMRCDSSKYDQLTSAQVFRTKTFALPALSAGRLYVRDEQTLKCLQISR